MATGATLGHKAYRHDWREGIEAQRDVVLHDAHIDADPMYHMWAEVQNCRDRGWTGWAYDAWHVDMPPGSR